MLTTFVPSEIVTAFLLHFCNIGIFCSVSKEVHACKYRVRCDGVSFATVALLRKCSNEDPIVRIVNCHSKENFTNILFVRLTF